MKKIVYSRVFLTVNRFILSFFYNKNFLCGYYFEEKRMGWLWAWKSLPNRIFRDRKIPWPVNRNSIVSNSKNIIFDLSSINVFQSPGCYFQAHKGKIYIGKNVHIAPNVGIITTNHDIYNVSNHAEGKNIVIGDRCWIGMNSVILPGVVLGPNTIVGAGATVTKSFTEGYCVIVGVPAKKIKTIKKL